MWHAYFYLDLAHEVFGIFAIFRPIQNFDEPLYHRRAHKNWSNAIKVQKTYMADN